jgi:UDP-N-acetyl-2-amino-2-deoxyglucuronate dehydrogenase
MQTTKPLRCTVLAIPLYYKNVIDVLRGEAEPETDGREGLGSLEVLIAAYRSARDGRTVSLPLEY